MGNDRLGKAIMTLVKELVKKDELTPAEKEFIEAVGETAVKKMTEEER